MAREHVPALLVLKVLAAVAGAVALAVGVSQWVSWRLQDERILSLATAHAEDLASSYFDGLNTLMLSGAMERRAILRDKFRTRPEVAELRLVRGPALRAQFGTGHPDEAPRDALDRRALEGERIVRVSRRDGKRLLTVLTPLRATKSTRGVDCLACHQVRPGTVLGVVRLDYDLTEIDGARRRDHLLALALSIGLGALGLALAMLLLRRVVTRPLARLRASMSRVERDSDLTVRVADGGRDDLGATARAFDSMVGRFGAALAEVRGAAHRMEALAERFVQAARRTEEDAAEQETATTHLAGALAELAASAREVAGHTAEAASATHAAEGAAKEGRTAAEETVGAMTSLQERLGRSLERMDRVESTSQDIERILDLIHHLAEETDLLALNAAIEAARAGEHGRGFAVVADEVRALAGKTRRATEEIGHLIARLRDSVRDTADALRAAGEESDRSTERIRSGARVLEQVARSMERIAQMNDQIAGAVAQQRAVTEEMSGTVEGMRVRAARTSRDARSTLDAGKELAAMAATLSGLVARFRLRDET